MSAISRRADRRENRRLHARNGGRRDRAKRCRGCGVACTTEAPQLAYPDLVRSFTEQARIHDLTVLDAEPVALAVDRGLIEAVLVDSGRP